MTDSLPAQEKFNPQGIVHGAAVISDQHICDRLAFQLALRRSFHIWPTSFSAVPDLRLGDILTPDSHCAFGSQICSGGRLY